MHLLQVGQAFGAELGGDDDGDLWGGQGLLRSAVHGRGGQRVIRDRAGAGAGATGLVIFSGVAG
ncbi:hypothetical protein, partial [Streptomyces sp. WAC06614]|uniref:hypothetical protein n=1 Tax=Streptomyces sp. WAC06614 TaxID=2487416 RepID=UPI001C8EBDA3